MSDLVARLLEKRGVTLPHDIERFLVPNYDRDTHHHSLLEGIERAVARVFSAMQSNERIAVYADFDCDGIPGASVLHDFFQKIGYTNIEIYIPHRDREGYGIHTDALTRLKERGVSLIITVDVGTVAIEPIRYAKEIGIDVIVTDHHEVKDILPDCIAVINPKLGSYPFKDLCGAAMAWKLVCALLAEGKKRELGNFTSIPDGWEKWLLDLVAIATVADLVPLVGENRALAHFGLTVLRKSPRAGIRALCSELRLRQNEITEDDIGFSFAPRINAASRMGDPEMSLKLLTAKDIAEAEIIARHLEELNTKRKSAVAVISKEARKRLHARYTEADRVVVLGDVAWKPSLLGLVANSIMEERGGVVCLWGANVQGDLKGSARSDGTLSVVELFTAAKDSFIEFGGHHASGGFSVSREHVHTLPGALAHAVQSLTEKEVTQSHEYDAQVTVREIAWPLYIDISRLAPFGMGNPKPVFRVARASVASMKVFGKQKNHVEVSLSCFDTGARARAFDFFRAPHDFSHVPASGASVDVLGTLVRDSFRGSHALALRVVDILKSTS
jgi:single-stranded-DNA-specific exonuclease